VIKVIYTNEDVKTLSEAVAYARLMVGLMPEWKLNGFDMVPKISMKPVGDK